MNWKFSCGVENLGVCILHINRDLTSFLRIAFLGGWGLTEIIVIYCLYYILIFFGENQVDFVQIFIWKGEVCFRWCVLYMRLTEIFLSASLFLAGYWHGRSVGRHHDIGNVSDHKRRTWGNHIKNDLNCNIPYYHMASM